MAMIDSKEAQKKLKVGICFKISSHNKHTLFCLYKETQKKEVQEKKTSAIKEPFILLDHPLSYALIATADVPVVYLQQFWMTVSKVPGPEDKFIPFVAPVNIETIEAFMIRVGYQGVVDKDFMNNVNQEKEAIQYPRFIKLIIADLMKKFLDISQRIEEDYHSIKDDIPLVSVYTTGNVLILGVLIPDAFLLTEEIHATNDFKEYKTVLEPRSHKDNPKHVVDDDEKDVENVDDEEGGEIGSLEIRTEEMQTSIPTPLRSPRTILSSDKNITWELTDTVSLPTTTTSNTSHSKRRISSRYSHLSEFNAQAPKIVEDLFKNYVQSNVIQVHPTTTTSTKTTSSGNLQQQLYFKMKRSLQDRANDPALWEVLKRKFEKYSTSNTSCREDEIHSNHDDHQEDDAPPEGEKRVKRHKTSKGSKSSREETVIDEDEYGNTKEKKYIFSLHEIHAERFLKVDLEEKMNRWVRKEFKTFNEDAQITEVVRITIDQPHGLDFMEQIIMMRENDKPDSFSEADFKYLNKNYIEDLYYLCRNKKANYRETKLMNSLITFIRSRVIWERVHDFQLGIESYQIKVNLTAPTLTFPGIKAHEPYSIIDKPSTSLIYLNSKDEKRVMYLTKIMKFCDATLEKVLKEDKEEWQCKLYDRENHVINNKKNKKNRDNDHG
ncbi:hypothetical protein Tco_0418019 [Tanacetum coccineum]